MSLQLIAPSAENPEIATIVKQGGDYYLITDSNTGKSKSVYATSQKEALQIFAGKIKEKPQPNKIQLDLNNDGKFDEKDASIAGKTLNQSKNL
jgi:hypothetical protein